MLNEMLYVVVDCYPNPGSDAFQRFAGGTAGCWIRPDLRRDGALAGLLKQNLEAAGWSIARILLQENVTSDTYAAKEEGRSYFEQARVDGFVTKFNVCKRQTIGGSRIDDEDVVEALLKLSSSSTIERPTSLYSSKDGQWANGVGSAETDFVPVWLNHSDALAWSLGWPNYDLRDITAEDFRAGLFEQINDADMWIGLCVERSLLTMCHPIWVRSVLSKDQVVV